MSTSGYRRSRKLPPIWASAIPTRSIGRSGSISSGWPRNTANWNGLPFLEFRIDAEIHGDPIKFQAWIDLLDEVAEVGQCVE